MLEPPQSSSAVPLILPATFPGAIPGPCYLWASCIPSPFVIFSAFPFSCSLPKENFNPEASGVKAGWIQVIFLLHNLMLYPLVDTLVFYSSVLPSLDLA